MTNLNSENADVEFERYIDAYNLSQASLPVDNLLNKQKRFNPVSGRNDVVFRMGNGGYIKIGEEDLPSPLQPVVEETPAQPPQMMTEAMQQPEVATELPVSDIEIQGAQQFNEEQRRIGNIPTLEDFDAAGYSKEIVEAAGLEQPETIEPLTQEQIQQRLETGGIEIATTDPTIRENAANKMSRYLTDIALQDLREELQAQGASERTIQETLRTRENELFGEAEVITNAIWGHKSGIGVADFATAGILDIQEGYRLYEQSLYTGNNTDRVFGLLLMAAGVGGLGGVAKAVKRKLPAIRERLNQPGPMPTTSMFGAGEIDRGLAAAGRFLDAPRARSVDEFAELAASGKLRQARTTEQDISDITEKKMPATVINLQGADDELSIAYESGEITDQLTNAGLFVDDDQMGTIYVGTTQENLDAIKLAENPAEIGKLSGYSDADIAAFYLKRRGGDKKAAFQEYRSDLADARAKERDQIGAREIDDIRVDRVEAPTEEKPGIIAFHGSGADFDEFKLDKINTGEGAQAFGYGLYFTDSKDIALFYKSAVRQAKDLREGYDVTYKGQPFKNLGDTPEAEVQGEEYFAVNAIIDSLNKVTTIRTRDLPQPELLQLAKEKAIEQVEQQIKSFGDDISEIRLNHLNESLDTLKSVDVNDVSFSKGKTYQVKLDVTPDELLDYDKPFNEQSLFAQQAILKTLDEMTLDDAVNMGVDLYGPPYNGKINKNTEQMAIQEAQNLMLKDFSVVRFLNDWSVLRGAKNSGEELLEKNGIKGIKYKANRGPGARNVPETGSDNYVIFDDKLIQIMKKYGIVGPIAVTAMKPKEQEEI